MSDVYSVLVLNQDYRPINICNGRRAIALLAREKAETVIDSENFICSPSSHVMVPEVIRLYMFIKYPLQRRKLSRRDVFARDGYTCQYCNTLGTSLTIDHILPRSRGGLHDWRNVVTACKRCNHRKAGRTPKEAGMKLTSLPHEPKPMRVPHFQDSVIKPGWFMFMPWANRKSSNLQKSAKSEDTNAHLTFA